MTDPFLAERRRDVRVQRFSLGVSAAVALALHAALVFSPGFRYRPVLEQAKVRPVIVARRTAASGTVGAVSAAPKPPSATAPAPPPRREPLPPPRATTAAPARGDAPVPQRPEAAPAEAASTQRNEAGLSPAPAAQAPAPPPRAVPVAEAARQPSAPTSGTMGLSNRGRGTGRDDWSALMADLSARGKTIEAKKAEAAREVAARGRAPGQEEGRGAGTRGAGVGQRGGQAGGTGSDPDGYVDPRIRVKVVSYPPTGIEDRYAPIPYPDLRVKRRELEAGICRVYYRVWVDGQGEIVRTQLKSPDTPAAQKQYAPFVDAVTRTVSRWPFDRTAAEIHIDVLFEIE